MLIEGSHRVQGNTVMIHQSIAFDLGVDPVHGEGTDDDDLLLSRVARTALNPLHQPGRIAEGGTVGLLGNSVEDIIDVGSIQAQANHAGRQRPGDRHARTGARQQAQSQVGTQQHGSVHQHIGVLHNRGGIGVGGNNLGKTHRHGQQQEHDNRTGYSPYLSPQGAAHQDSKKAHRSQQGGQHIQPRHKRSGKGVGRTGHKEEHHHLLIGRQQQRGQLGNGITAARLAHPQVFQQLQSLYLQKHL